MRITEEEFDDLLESMISDYEYTKNKSREDLTEYELGFINGVQTTMKSYIELAKRIKPIVFEKD